MKKTLAIATCLIAFGPAAALADSYRHATVVVHSHPGHGVTRHVFREVVRGASHRNAGKSNYQRYRASRDDLVYGRVISVEPVYQVTHYDSRHDSCVRRVDSGPSYRSHTSTVLGAVIGAAVGHSLGDSHGDPKAAAIAGGVLGASIGRDIGNHARESRRLAVTGPCLPAAAPQYSRREVVEYVVRYRYNGDVYRTSTNYDPGEWIALDVDINPA
jgi:uncharacterized protein YcfJ